MNLYGCVFEGKQENHIVRLFVGCITVESSFVETFLGHRTLGAYPRYRAATLWNLTSPWTLFDVLFF